MRLASSILILLLFEFVKVHGQTRTITGRVITENFETLPKVSIQTSDSVFLGTTDTDGRFEIEIATTTDELLISWIGMEWKTIQLLSNCNHLDIILMYDAHYDFMSARRIDRLRERRFKKLHELHLEAYKKGLFSTKQPCYGQEFEPIKDRLKEINQKRKIKKP